MKLLTIRQGKWHVLAHCRDRGTCDLMNFLNGLEGDLRADLDKLLVIFNRTATEGPSRRTEISKAITGRPGIFEFRAGRLRVFYFYDEGKVIVCTNGIIKTTRKTPTAVLDHAETIQRQYFRAKECGELEIQEELPDDEVF